MKLVKLPLFYKFDNQKYVYVNPEGIEVIRNWNVEGQVRIIFRNHSVDVEGNLDDIINLLSKGVKMINKEKDDEEEKAMDRAADLEVNAFLEDKGGE